MSHEIELQRMTVAELAQRCAQETKLFFQYLSHDTSYCFELFRRAISERDDPAWKAIVVQYKPSVARWVNRWADKHPDFPLAREEEEDFVAEAFARFWSYFTAEKFSNSQTLGAVLTYLKMCVNGAISDAWRKMHRAQFDRNLAHGEGGNEPAAAELEPTPEELLENKEFWQLIKKKSKDSKEFTVVYASFCLGLSPRQILAEYPGLFSDIKEIYQCKANFRDRLERDEDLKEFARRR